MHDAIQTRLQNIEWSALETLVADLWDRRGWTTEQTPARNDGGIDVIATREFPVHQTHLLQVKGGSQSVGVSTVREAAAHLLDTHVDAAFLITTGRFTGDAVDQARDLNLKLINRDTLARLVVHHNATDLLGPAFNTPAIAPATDQQSSTPSHTAAATPSQFAPSEPVDAATLRAIYAAHREAPPTQSTPQDVPAQFLEFSLADVDATTNPVYQFAGGLHTLLELTETRRDRLRPKLASSDLTPLDSTLSDTHLTLTVQPDRASRAFDPATEVQVTKRLLSWTYDAPLADITAITPAPPIWEQTATESDATPS